MKALLKILFFGLIVRPVVLVGLGLNVLNRAALPQTGPAILAANHNSHLDTLVLMSLYPLASLPRIRPVAAADYFLSNRLLAWFALDVLGIIPLDRSGATKLKSGLFDDCTEALARGEILIIFPEGSRGAPEQMGKIRKGLYYLAFGETKVPVTPIVMRGLGQALPRGEALLVPFNCDVVVGDPLADVDSSNAFITRLASTYEELLAHCLTKVE